LSNLLVLCGACGFAGELFLDFFAECFDSPDFKWFSNSLEFLKNWSKNWF
jgi:hypothetical protein